LNEQERQLIIFEVALLSQPLLEDFFYALKKKMVDCFLLESTVKLKDNIDGNHCAFEQPLLVRTIAPA